MKKVVLRANNKEIIDLLPETPKPKKITTGYVPPDLYKTKSGSGRPKNFKCR